MSGPNVMPMFPLGSVLLPGGVLPLHIFEPRYRALVTDCLAGDGEFGVVLIERGSEVGGGDVRSSVGTVARIVAAQPLDGGRWAVVTVGARRIRIARWLEDDPYPRAEVEDWPDPVDFQVATPGQLANLTVVARRAMALAAEVGKPTGEATQDVSSDPAVGTYQLAALSPLGPLDRQRVLSEPSSEGRCLLLQELLLDEVATLAAQLSLEPEAEES